MYAIYYVFFFVGVVKFKILPLKFGGGGIIRFEKIEMDESE
jgi:hypothetical protein